LFTVKLLQGHNDGGCSSKTWSNQMKRGHRRATNISQWLVAGWLTTTSLVAACSAGVGSRQDAGAGFDSAAAAPDASAPFDGAGPIDAATNDADGADAATRDVDAIDAGTGPIYEGTTTFDAAPEINGNAGSGADAMIDAADSGPPPSFGPGIYYRQPNLSDPTGVLTRVAPPLASSLVMSPVGFDVRGDQVVFPYPAGLVVVDSSGRRREVPVPGLYGVVRPSLSPDGRRVAVQASSTPTKPATDLDIFVLSLDDGSSQRISDLPWNEESPAWFPHSNRIAYSSFSPTDGVNLHVYDVDAGKETLLVKDGGALHVVVSPDEKQILDFWRLRAYDSTTGALVSDLRAVIEAALSASGYAPDAAHPGQGGRMTFVLDGAFSPDGKSLVLDGAVTRDGQSGSVLFTTPLTPVALTAVSAIIPLNYTFSNDNNFSQLYPTWR
jgi:hypothetical protein